MIHLCICSTVLPNVIKNIREILSINFEIKNIEAYITNQDIPLETISFKINIIEREINKIKKDSQLKNDISILRCSLNILQEIPDIYPIIVKCITEYDNIEIILPRLQTLKTKLIDKETESKNEKERINTTIENLKQEISQISVMISQMKNINKNKDIFNSLKKNLATSKQMLAKEEQKLIKLRGGKQKKKRTRKRRKKRTHKRKSTYKRKSTRKKKRRKKQKKTYRK